MFNLDFPSIFPIPVVLSWNSSLSHSPHDALAVQAGQECCEPDMFSKSSPKQKRSKTTEKLSRTWQPKSKTWTLWEVYFKFAHEGSTLEKVELGAQLCCRWPISCVEAMDITYNLHKFWGSLPSLFLPWEGSMAKKLRLVTFATPLQKWRSYRRRNKKSGNFHVFFFKINEWISKMMGWKKVTPASNMVPLLISIQFVKFLGCI